MAHPKPTDVNPTAKHAHRFWGSAPLPKSKAEFFDAITAPAPTGGGSVATIRMYGPIDSWGGYWGVSAKDVGDVLDALPDSVERIVLRINSPGGEVFEAVSILNMFRAHKATVTAVVDGLAASAASVIAASCNETIMSPGTQMMLHSPLTFSYGNAADLRKDADVLDTIEASLIELYSAKAGAKNWPEILAADTWLTATQAVDLGLADRVAVIPDAGETETVGSDDQVIVLPDSDEPEDSAARVVRILARTPRAQAPTLPSSTEPGEPIREENAVAYSDLTAGIRKRLGITEAAATDETLLAALDEALAEQPNTPTVPAGTTLIDSAVLADLQASAAEGRQARAQQDQERRERLVASALQEGRISPATRQTWLDQLEANEQGTSQLLASLPKNTIPVAALGHSDDVETPEDALYNSLFGNENKGA